MVGVPLLGLPPHRHLSLRRAPRAKAHPGTTTTKSPMANGASFLQDADNFAPGAAEDASRAKMDRHCAIEQRRKTQNAWHAACKALLLHRRSCCRRRGLAGDRTAWGKALLLHRRPRRRRRGRTRDRTAWGKAALAAAGAGWRGTGPLGARRYSSTAALAAACAGWRGTGPLGARRYSSTAASPPPPLVDFTSLRLYQAACPCIVIVAALSRLGERA